MSFFHIPPYLRCTLPSWIPPYVPWLMFFTFQYQTWKLWKNIKMKFNKIPIMIYDDVYSTSIPLPYILLHLHTSHPSSNHWYGGTYPLPTLSIICVVLPLCFTSTNDDNDMWLSYNMWWNLNRLNSCRYMACSFWTNFLALKSGKKSTFSSTYPITK